jgi:hypothetical protein
MADKPARKPNSNTERLVTIDIKPIKQPKTERSTDTLFVKLYSLGKGIGMNLVGLMLFDRFGLGSTFPGFDL